ncbi:MAG TPA: 50S ribosomal protein L23 [archaeon]|nr:50S ribosomal protein L23 [archaeon]
MVKKDLKTGKQSEEKKTVKKGLFNKLKREKPVKTAEIQKPLEDPFDVIKFVLMTEKSIRMVELQNKLVFIVNRPSKRPQIKQAIESAFGSPISGITILVDQDGRKKAFVKFKNAGAAGDIAIKLGII